MSAIEFALRCRCGQVIQLDDRRHRGTWIDCRCGQPYFVPRRARALSRLCGRIAWAWRSWRAGARARTLPAPSPYRSAAPPIACPACGEPSDASQRWGCTYCHCSWDTFSTGDANISRIKSPLRSVGSPISSATSAPNTQPEHARRAPAHPKHPRPEPPPQTDP